MWCLGPSRGSHTVSYRHGHALSTLLSRDLCLSTHQMSVTLKSDGITTCSELCVHAQYAPISRSTRKNYKDKANVRVMFTRSHMQSISVLFRLGANNVLKPLSILNGNESIFQIFVLSQSIHSVEYCSGKYTKICRIWNITRILTLAALRSYLLWKQIVSDLCLQKKKKWSSTLLWLGLVTELVKFFRNLLLKVNLKWLDWNITTGGTVHVLKCHHFLFHFIAL